MLQQVLHLGVLKYRSPSVAAPTHFLDYLPGHCGVSICVPWPTGPHLLNVYPPQGHWGKEWKGTEVKNRIQAPREMHFCLLTLPPENAPAVMSSWAIDGPLAASGSWCWHRCLNPHWSVWGSCPRCCVRAGEGQGVEGAAVEKGIPEDAV